MRFVKTASLTTTDLGVVNEALQISRFTRLREYVNG